ncbi:MAG: hypothetical protein G3M70_06005 [Candidatus Nitronauta litoralis]|uniref:Uncharacterized protein n=1 Tax=Candidatus Nitronauta litoralis TaxID=2705533 RepID=A0A7T0BV77_9BACT|nr:MAG: hypothetical protein G3M70_06005 [Candidatus Nitronauta litoralis]
MKVEMKTTQYACPEGHTVVRYSQGQQVDLPDLLAKLFIKEGWAHRVSKRQTKAQGAAPENKSRKGNPSERGIHGS